MRLLGGDSSPSSCWAIHTNSPLWMAIPIPSLLNPKRFANWLSIFQVEIAGLNGALKYFLLHLTASLGSEQTWFFQKMYAISWEQSKLQAPCVETPCKLYLPRLGGHYTTTRIRSAELGLPSASKFVELCSIYASKTQTTLKMSSYISCIRRFECMPKSMTN